MTKVICLVHSPFQRVSSLIYTEKEKAQEPHGFKLEPEHTWENQSLHSELLPI
jgi:hypothetical protein